MKKVCLLLLMLIAFKTFSQEPKISDNFTVVTGEEYGETDGIFKEFYNHKDYAVAINSQKKDLVIQKFNTTTLVEVERVQLKNFMKDKGHHGKLIRIGEKVIFFYEDWDKKKQVESLMAIDISLNDLSISDPYVFLDQQGKIVRNGLRGPNASGMLRAFGYKYFFQKSFDKKKLLVAYQLRLNFDDDEKRLRQFVIRIYDSELNLESNEVIEMPYTIKEMENEDFAIDKHGNFYMIAKIYENGRKDEKNKEKEINYHLSLLKVKVNTNEVLVNTIKIGDKYIDDIALYESGTGDIFVGGTCKNPERGVNSPVTSKKNGEPTGLFAVKFTEEGEVLDFTSFDFPADILSKHTTKKEKRKSKKNKKNDEIKPTFEDLKITSIAINTDGSFLILGEQRYVRENTRVNSGGSTSTSYSYLYLNILAAKINADGTLAWIHKLPKFQIGRHGKGSMSFTHMFAGDYHYLLYLDNIKNLNLADDEYPERYVDKREGYFTAYIINDETGEVRKEAIFNTLDIDGVEIEHFDTDKILSLSDSEILIEGFEGKNKDFLIKVSAK